MSGRLRALSLACAGLIATAGCIDLSRPSGERSCASTHSCDPGFVCDGSRCIARASCDDQFSFDGGNDQGFQTPASQTTLSGASFVARQGSCGPGALRLDAAYGTTGTSGVAYAMVPNPPIAMLTGKTVYGDIRLEGPALPATMKATVFVASDLTQPRIPGMQESLPQSLIADAWVHLSLAVGYQGSVTYVGVTLVEETPADWTGTVYLDQIGWR
jgi:hypothetical protein